MGYYTQFKSKEIILRKDTPKEVLNFLDATINNLNFEPDPPTHRLFAKERWLSLFSKSIYGEPVFTKLDSGYYKLFIWCDINYGFDEIEAFVEWITPYVAGRKAKEFIGWKLGESDETPTNLYIERT